MITKLTLAAFAADLDAAGLALCAGLAEFCVVNQWHSLGQTSRGGEIAAACLRASPYVAQAADPAPLQQDASPAT